MLGCDIYPLSILQHVHYVLSLWTYFRKWFLSQLRVRTSYPGKILSCPQPWPKSAVDEHIKITDFIFTHGMYKKWFFSKVKEYKGISNCFRRCSRYWLWNKQYFWSSMKSNALNRSNYQLCKECHCTSHAFALSKSVCLVIHLLLEDRIRIRCFWEVRSGFGQSQTGSGPVFQNSSSFSMNTQVEQLAVGY